LGVARVLLIVIGAVLSILGTFVFALYGGGGAAGSGIGFLLNTVGGGIADPTLFAGASLYAAGIGIEIWLYFILLVLFLIFLVAGVLQLVGIKSRVVGLIFSLFPLAVGIMFCLLFFTEILGTISGSFATFFIGTQFGNFFPIMVDLGAIAPTLSGVGIGAFFLVGGGTLGLIGSILPKD